MGSLWLCKRDSEQKAKLQKEILQVLRIKEQFEDWQFYGEKSKLQIFYIKNMVERVPYDSQKREGGLGNTFDMEIEQRFGIIKQGANCF